MTGWISPSNARHIPEEELHAYLDQALSRSQCVEIECHLAECRRCQEERDEVAAVRDRTTSLLAEIGPTRVIAAPPFERLVARHHQRQATRHRAVIRVSRAGLWAASLAAAVLTGWFGRGMFQQPTSAAPVTVAIEAPASTAAEPRTLTAVGPVQSVAEPAAPAPVEPAAPVITTPPRATIRSAPAGIPVRTTRRDVEPMMMVSSVGAEDAFALEGFWHSFDLQEASRQTNANLPLIDGLAIIDIQLQRNGSEERPMIVVTQQHPSGRIIQTVEGPVQRVEALLDRQLARDPTELKASAPAFTPPDYLGDGSAATRRALRVLTVTGHLPTDSLNAMARSITLR